MPQTMRKNIPDEERETEDQMARRVLGRVVSPAHPTLLK
jgi:hypothetical protein